MKKLLTLFGLALLSMSASAQAFDPHIGIGVGVGTTGIDIDASVTINDYIGIRGGVDIMPKIKIDADVDLKTDGANKKVGELKQYVNQINAYLPAGKQISANDFNQLPEKMKLEGKLNNTTGHILIDIHPFKTSFRLTVGAYFGPDEIIGAYNKEDGFFKPVNQWNNAIIESQQPGANPAFTNLVKNNNLEMLGAKLGDYFITPDANDPKNNAEANIKVNGFRPYLGLGFGRAVPKKRIGCQFDLGVQFWGKPEVIAPTYDNGTFKVESLKAGNSGDGDDALKTISKISVYPVLNFRLVGRIF